jgi:hypothetical protein
MNLTFFAAETKFQDSLHFPKLKKGIFFSILVPDKGAVCTVVLTEKGRLLYFSVEVGPQSGESHYLPPCLPVRGRGRRPCNVFSAVTL